MLSPTGNHTHKGRVEVGSGLANQGPTMGDNIVDEEIRKDTLHQQFDAAGVRGTNIPTSPNYEGNVFSSSERMYLARSRREYDEITYKQLVTDVALREVSSRIQALAKPARVRAKEIKDNLIVDRQAKTNQESAIDFTDSNDPLLCKKMPVDPSTMSIYGEPVDFEYLKTLTRHPTAREWLETHDPSRKWVRFAIGALKAERRSSKYLFVAREWLVDSRNDSDVVSQRVQRNYCNSPNLEKGYAVRTAGAKQSAKDAMAMMWMGDGMELTIVDDDGDVLMEHRPVPPIDYVYRQGAYASAEPMDVDEVEKDVIMEDVDKTDEIIDQVMPSATESTTLSWEVHKNPDWGDTKYTKVGMRSWFDWMGITKFQNATQTAEDAAIGAAALLAYDAMDDEHVDVKPVVKTWDYLKGRVAGVFGKRKYNVLHRSANRFNRRVAVVKTLVAELRANAPGVFSKSEADKRALHLCAKQIVEKAWKEGVELGVDCEVRKIRRNERAYYLSAVCTAYHLGDDDSAFWKALESAPDPHQA